MTKPTTVEFGLALLICLALAFFFLVLRPTNQDRESQELPKNEADRSPPRVREGVAALGKPKLQPEKPTPRPKHPVLRLGKPSSIVAIPTAEARVEERSAPPRSAKLVGGLTSNQMVDSPLVELNMGSVPIGDQKEMDVLATDPSLRLLKFPPPPASLTESP